MIWRVNYTDDALRDLQGIFDYISKILLEPGIAVKQADRIMYGGRNVDKYLTEPDE